MIHMEEKIKQVRIIYCLVVCGLNYLSVAVGISQWLWLCCLPVSLSLSFFPFLFFFFPTGSLGYTNTSLVTNYTHNFLIPFLSSF